MNRRNLVAALLILSSGVLLFAGRREKSVVLALSGRDVAESSARSASPAEEILERAKVLGVSAVALREDTVAAAVERGEILQFTRSELEKWKALGLIAGGAPARAGSLWVKDKEVLERLAEAAARRGIAMTTASVGGFSAADFPPESDPSGLGLGLEPELLSAAGKAGLAAASGPMREVPLEDGCGETLRAAFELPVPALLLRFSPALDKEGNFDLLRQCAGRLRDLGVSFAPPAREAGHPHPLAAWLLMALGPLLAARVGLRTVRRARLFAQTTIPQASPIAEVAAGVLAAGAAATLAGLSIQALGGLALHDPASRGPALLAFAAPLLFGGFVLYWADLPCSGMVLKTPLTPLTLLRGAAVAAAFFALKPGHHLTPWMNRVTSLYSPLWWWPWRWREIFVGFPCLVTSFAALNRIWGCPDCGDPVEGSSGEEKKKEDARLWLLAGLLGPAGMIAALGDSGVPIGLGLGQAWTALFLGSILGGIGLARCLCSRRK